MLYLDENSERKRIHDFLNSVEKNGLDTNMVQGIADEAKRKNMNSRQITQLLISRHFKEE